jgi:hypothetical protein
MNLPRTLILTVTISLAGLSGALAGDTPTNPRWRIAGDLEEACLCHAPCPCWFNSLPTKMHCGGAQILFIKRGHYGKIRLDGLSVGHFGKSPAGKTMMDSFGHWEFSYVYIDERAKPAQRAALEAIARATLPVAASANVRVQTVPIHRTVAPGRHQVRVGNVATFDGRLLDGGLGGPAKISNPPGADPIHHAYLQGRTTTFIYTDAGQNWDAPESNYMLGEFDVTSAQYEKHAIGLAQKMAARGATGPGATP